MPLQFSQNNRNAGSLNFTTSSGAVLASVGIGEATQAEAEAGTILGRYMSPLRVAQAIDALGITSLTGPAGTFLAGNGASDAAFRAITGADLPNPTPTTLGGVFSAAASSGSVLSGIGTDGVPTVATSANLSATLALNLTNNTTPRITFGTSGNVIGELFATGTNGQIDLFNSGGRMLRVNGASTAVNFLNVMGGAASGGGVGASAQGNDASVALFFQAKSANVDWYTSSTDHQVAFLHTAGVTRRIGLTGSVAGNSAITAIGGGVVTLNGVDITTSAAASIKGSVAGGNTADLTVPQVNSLLGTGYILAGYAIGVDFNAVGDTAITITLPTTRYKFNQVVVQNTGTTASLTTAQMGLFSASGGGGAAIIASGTALSSITSNTVNTDRNATAPAFTISGQNVFDYSTLFFRITQAQGAAASGNVYLFLLPIPSS